MATRGAPKATAAMCCLTLGHLEILLPADAGLKVVQLMRGALCCGRDYDSNMNRVYVLRDELDVEYINVRPGQVRAAAPPAEDPDTPSTVLRLGRELMKLPRP